MKVLIEEGLVVSESRSKRTVHAPGQRQRNEVRTVTPHVVLIGGYAGSGKSELGRIIARETGWPMIDKDTITRPVVEATWFSRGRQSPAYSSLRARAASLGATNLHDCCIA
ncbi:MAG: hypothetical protein ABW022_03255 [Actinoplanes sp.]